MSEPKAVLRELLGMFVGDPRLALAVLLTVAVAAALVEFTRIDPLIGAGLLAFGLPLVLVADLRRVRSASRR